MITSAAMRIGNNQLGCEPDDLHNFLDVLDRNGFPEWLDGTIDTDRGDAWQVYIRETLANYWNFLLEINKMALGGYFGVVLLIAMVQARRKQSGIEILWGGTKKVLLSHFVVILLTAALLRYFRNTPWMKDVYAGRTLMRPFPPVEKTLIDDPTISGGPTTFPSRRDVLFGGRLDARTIGAYNRWLEFHPGNQQFFRDVATMGNTYRFYGQGLSPIFRQAVMNTVMEPILTTGGRFLQQDYRTGDWLEMHDEERDAMVQKTLFVGVEGLLFDLQKEFNFLVGDARFGYARETAMARTSLCFLRDLDIKLFGRMISKAVTTSKSKDFATTNFITALMLEPISNLQNSVKTRRDWLSRWTATPLVEQKFVIGEEVMYTYASRKKVMTTRVQATVIGIHQGGEILDIAFYEKDAYREGLSKTVPQTALEKFSPFTEGTLVISNYEGKGQWFPGKIIAMGPDGSADIEYEDGEYESGVGRDLYRPRLE